MFQPPKSPKARPRPRRSLPGSAVVPTEKEIARELAGIAKAFAKKASVMAKGEATAKQPELAGLRKAANALLASASVEAIRAADVETLAAASRVQLWHDFKLSLLKAVAHARGPADAVQIAARSLGYDLAADGGYTNAAYLVTAANALRTWGEPWAPVRNAVCAAPDDAYREARARAQEIRARLGLPARAFVSYAFPDEPWGAEDLRACLADAELAPKHHEWGFLLSACSDAALVKEFASRDRSEHTLCNHALDLAAALPEGDALAALSPVLDKLLVKPAYGAVAKTPPRDVAGAIACLRTPAAAEVLAKHFGHAILGPVVAEFFQDAPELRGALEALAKGKTKAGEAAARILRARERVEGPVAEAEQVPKVLAARPWRPRKSAAPIPAVEGLAVLEAPESIDLTDAERVRDPAAGSRHPVREMAEDELSKWRKAVAEGRYSHADFEFQNTKSASGAWELLRVPPAEGLKAWQEGEHVDLHGTPLEFLALHGVAALPRFLETWTRQLGWEGGERHLEAMLRVRSARLAPSMAYVAARRRKWRKAALGWLARNAELAAVGLIPDAVGSGPAATREDARDALFDLAQRGHREAVLAVARRYGESVVPAVEALLDRDPLRIDIAAPKPPHYLRVPDLSPVLLRDGGAHLGEEAVEALLEMLRVSPLAPPYPGVARVAEACSPESLGAFARDLLEQWVLAGANGRHEWMLFAVAHFPSDAATRRVAALAREWARKDAAKAGRACTALAAIGSDLALMHLGHVAETSRFERLRADAAELLQEAAAARGLTPEALGDRTVPDFDLGPDGTLELSFGERRFKVSLDEALRPVVFDAEGHPLKSMPRATKADDAALAKAAKARFDTLKADAEAVADRQLRRLERAMVAQRAWTADEFRQRLVEHPLLGHLARRLVFEALTPEGAPQRFRVAEDRSYASGSDESLALPPDVRVRIVHPALMAPDEREAWAKLLADYQLAQPFAQLGRPVAALEPAERGARAWERCKGVVASAGRVLGTLEARGWQREGGGHVASFERRCSNELVARLCLTPGIDLEDLKNAPVQTLGAVEVQRLAGGAQATLGELDAVDFAEVARDVEALRG